MSSRSRSLQTAPKECAVNDSKKIKLAPRYQALITLLIAALERKRAPESAKAHARATLLKMAEAADSYLESTRKRRNYTPRGQGGKKGGAK